MKPDRIEHIFKFMEYENLTDNQLNLVESFEEFYLNNGHLTKRQGIVLEDVFKQAAEK